MTMTFSALACPRCGEQELHAVAEDMWVCWVCCWVGPPGSREDA